MSQRDLTKIDWSQLAGWHDDDHRAAFDAFCVSARHMVDKPYPTRGLDVASETLVAISRKSLGIESLSAEQARRFFETHFIPHVLKGNIGRLDERSQYDPLQYRAEYHLLPGHCQRRMCGLAL